MVLEERTIVGEHGAVSDEAMHLVGTGRVAIEQSASLPPPHDPSARPLMKLVSPALAAYTVTPKTSDSMRSQTTW